MPSAKPLGPLIIAISIQKQRMKVYDANGVFAETPISTGMAGHPTPMGVFSVIQKQKLHHSNIYSGAPMPYMQRITWSGIAIHAGVLPGYPASHGCIRMPMAFAVKMWGWTRMGARVVVTPGDMTPATFSHPLLMAQRAAPQPMADEPKPDVSPATKTDKASDANGALHPTILQASLDLRPTVGHDDGVKPVRDEPSASAALRDRTRTADASAALPTANAPVTMSDAPSSVGIASPSDEAAVKTDAPAMATDAIPAKTGDASGVETKPEAATSETVSPAAEPASAKVGETTSSDAKEVETKSPGANPAEHKPAENKPESVKAVTDISPMAPDAQKDRGNVPDAVKPATSLPAPAALAAPKRSGQIAVFISRKDSRIYVRQNFAPLFDAPVTIAASDRPLGTHVFTAQVDKNDANALRWSVVSLPVPARYAERRDEDDRAARRRKIAGAADIKAVPVPDSPAEALDRLTIPADTMARIAEQFSTGSSIIVSDQGIAGGETGEGTDFIVSLR